MSYRYEREQYRPQRRSGLRGCLITLTVLVWLLVLAFVVLRFYVQPRITDYVKQQIAQRLNPGGSPLPNAGEALREGLKNVPSVEIPRGTLQISEAQANEFASEYAQVPLIDGMRVRFVPGQVQVDVTARGFTSTAHIRPTVQDGRIVAAEPPSLDQPLGSILQISDITNAVLERLNAEAVAQGKRVTNVDIQQGQAIVTVE